MPAVLGDPALLVRPVLAVFQYELLTVPPPAFRPTSPPALFAPPPDTAPSA